MPLKLAIKVVPGASKDAVVGWLGTELKLCVAAQPEKGKANKSAEKLLAAELGLPTKNVQVLSGKTSPHKIIGIEGLSKAELMEKLPDEG
jgi:uncharacterized protein (TIGR00251 family)